MKRSAIIGAGILVLLVALVLFRQQQAQPKSAVVPLPSPTIPIVNDTPIGKNVSYENSLYQYRFIRIPQGTRIILVENFSKQESVQTIIQQHACTAGINAGYYTTDHLPLGKWNNGNTALESAGDTRFINSFVSTDETSRMVAITAEEPILYGWYFQTGPQLFGEGSPFPLRIKNDEPARRSILIKLTDESTIFLSLFGQSSVLSGPLLGDAPGILSVIGQQESWEIDAATNLDGGRASFFWDGTRVLDEVTPVGSVLCVTEE